MSNLRFMLAAVALFAGAFVGVSYGMPWAAKGFGVMAMRAAPVKPDARASAVEQPAAGTRSEHAALEARPAAVAAPQRVPARHHLTQSAVQAAQAYARAPCDRMAKTAFIVAASTYLRAKASEPAATPEDARVHEAIKTALETGAITKDEFPTDTVFSGRIAAAPSSKTACVNSAGLLP